MLEIPQNSIKNLLVRDFKALPNKYDLSPLQNKYLYYILCNTKARLEITTKHKICINPVIKYSELDFYIFQALNLSVKHTYYSDSLTKSLFYKMQNTNNKYFPIENILLHPNWKKHYDYIGEKILNVCFFYDDHMPENEILLLPNSNLVGILTGFDIDSYSTNSTNKEKFNVLIHKSNFIHRIIMTNIITVDHFFKNMMDEALA